LGINGNWEKTRTGEVARLGEIGRRRFIALSGASAAALVFGAGPFAVGVEARPRFSGYPFTLGVASGDPQPDGVVIWTRLAPKPLAEDGRGGMGRRAVRVRWEVASDERFRRVVRKGETGARPELGHSVHVEVGGLRPDREYYYRFHAGSETSPTGRTKTLPGPTSASAEMTFAFASCQQYEHGFFTAYRRMSEENLDFVVHLGDYIYEYGTNEYRAPGGNVRFHKGPEIATLNDYRVRHAQYKTDKDLQAAHRAFPFVVTWDDHEVENNYADEIPEEGNSPEAFLRRRAAAYQAYYEHMPLRRSSVPKGPDMRIYRRLTYGTLAEFNVLDTRQYRDDQPNGDEFNSSPSEESRDPNRTITGDAQERWLLEGLAASDARWNVLAQQVFFSQVDFDFDEGVGINPDAWDGYAAQRDRFVDHFRQRGVSNPVVLTGDVHANWASEILDDFDNPDSQVVGAEFVATSITSGGDGSDTRSDTAETLAENPHIKFFNNQRGYVRCTLTPETWRTDYRVVPFVSQPDSRVFTRASFVVEDANPGIRQVADNGVPVAQRVAPATEADRIALQKKADGRSGFSGGLRK
jgi:alkaline phosphatase D